MFWLPGLWFPYGENLQGRSLLLRPALTGATSVNITCPCFQYRHKHTRVCMQIEISLLVWPNGVTGTRWPDWQEHQQQHELKQNHIDPLLVALKLDLVNVMRNILLLKLDRQSRWFLQGFSQQVLMESFEIDMYRHSESEHDPTKGCKGENTVARQEYQKVNNMPAQSHDATLCMLHKA